MASHGPGVSAYRLRTGIRPANSNFINYGGSVSWVITAAQASTVEVWYIASYNNIYHWVNDSNGVPRPVAVRITE